MSRKYTVKILHQFHCCDSRWLISRFILCCPSWYPPTKKYAPWPLLPCQLAIAPLRLAVWWSTFGPIHCWAFAECEPFGLLSSDTWTNATRVQKSLGGNFLHMAHLISTGWKLSKLPWFQVLTCLWVFFLNLFYLTQDHIYTTCCFSICFMTKVFV